MSDEDEEGGEALGSTGPDVIAEAADTLTETAGKLEETSSGLARKVEEWLEGMEWLPGGGAEWVSLVLLTLGLGLLSWLVYVVLRPLLLKVVKILVVRSSFTWDDQLLGHGVFRWATHLFPAILIGAIAPGLFSESSPLLATALSTFAKIYMVVAGYFAIDSLLNAVRSIYSETKFAKEFQINTFVQVVKLGAALVATVLLIAICIGRSPLVLIGGLGVFASVLMLIFKDVILGFVAGIQLASNRMLSPGDWVQMPNNGADGSVQQIGLTTVKVRNWDNTITTVPTHDLVTSAFKNWEGMSKSGARRIKRNLAIHTSSIKLCDDELLARLREVEHLSKHLREKEDEIGAWNKERGYSDDPNRVNARQLTNIGVFRAYIEAYLRAHPGINKDLTIMVRQLEPGGDGVPLELYCFSNTTVWADYESIQADIFDHLLAVAPEFELEVFQRPSGRDLRGMGKPIAD